MDPFLQNLVMLVIGSVGTYCLTIFQEKRRRRTEHQVNLLNQIENYVESVLFLYASLSDEKSLSKEEIVTNSIQVFAMNPKISSFTRAMGNPDLEKVYSEFIEICMRDLSRFIREYRSQPEDSKIFDINRYADLGNILDEKATKVYEYINEEREKIV